MTLDAFMHFEDQNHEEPCDTHEEGVHGATAIPAPGTLSNFEPVFPILVPVDKPQWPRPTVGVPAWKEAVHEVKGTVHAFSSGSTLCSSEDRLLLAAVLLLLLLFSSLRFNCHFIWKTAVCFNPQVSLRILFVCF